MNPVQQSDFERTMALLIFRPTDNLITPLAELLEPSLRKQVADQVNQTLLRGNGERAKVTLHDLVSHRAWVQQKAKNERRDFAPETLDLGLDPVRNGAKGAENGDGGRIPE